MICVLLGLAGLFFYLQYTKPIETPKQPNSWSFRVKEKEWVPPFLCKKGQYYTFRAPNGIAQILIEGKEYRFKRTDIGQAFTISFPEDRHIQVEPYLGGTLIKRAYLQIDLGKQSNCPEALFLTPGKYSSFSVPVNKGAMYELQGQDEVYFIGHFRGNELFQEDLVKSGEGYWVSCWENSTLRLKAGEVPLLFVVKSQPYRPQLEIEYGCQSDHDFNQCQKRWLSEAYYLIPGESIKTPIWLDQGDMVSVRNRVGPMRLICSIANETREDPKPTPATGEDILEETSPKPDKPEEKQPEEQKNACSASPCGIEAKEAGYLSIKSLGLSVISQVSVWHKQRWSLDLKEGQEEQIEVHRGDVIRTASNGRYYVDGRIMEKELNYNHSISRDGHMTIKQGLDPRQISIQVVSRRGF
jgi:hypothetical protein